MMRLDIRGRPGSSDWYMQNGGAYLKPFYGIQEIPDDVDGAEFGIEWGGIRARLNETTPGETREHFLYQYLHEKDRPGDYTHGCICERSEVILNHLVKLNPQATPRVPVWVKRP